MNKEKFVSKVFNELLEEQFSIFIHQKKKVENCGGWFDCDKREFVVSMKNPMGYEIMIHEYSHFLQWRDNHEYFMKLGKHNTKVFEWLDGKDLSDKVLETAILKTIELEWDCERQSLDLIKKLNLEVDVAKYKKAANAYLMFYHSVWENRKWASKSPYNNNAIMRLTEPEFQPLDYYLDSGNFTKGLQTQYKKILLE